MKLLFLVGGTFVSGLEVIALSLMRELRSVGNDVRAVVNGWNDGDFPRRLTDAEIPFSAVKLGRFYKAQPLWSLATLLEAPRATLAVRRQVRDFDPDVVLHIDITSAFWPIRILPGHDHVLWLHDPPDHRFDGAAGRATLAKIKGVICVSEFIAARVRQRSPASTVTTVNNGVPLPRRVETRAQPSSSVRMGIIGQLLPRKGHALLLEAIAALPSATRSRTELLIFGPDSGVTADALRTRVSELGLDGQVRWMGYVVDRDLIYGALDIVCAPAVDEPFGTTALEAGAYGLPLVAADSGGFPEAIVHEETGLLAAPGDVDALSSALARLVDDEPLRRRFGEAAKARIAQQFSIGAMAVRFMAALDQFGISERAR
jgi:glycosyltransferase involved in cell wall biosynthesis